ncbi:MAG: hypothetical protein LBC76_08465 [Treponema sp.]|jgi:hypothetical protein|nr:hypothetical protein [Treponema sp.]
MKNLSILIILFFLLIAGCASSKNTKAAPAKQADEKQAWDMMASIPYMTDSSGATWSYPIFQPAVPADVPGDIYTKLWNINLKTINAGKYDYDAVNFNPSKWITYNESAMSDNFAFTGICADYADYYIFVLKHDAVLLDLLNKGVITVNNSTTHRWIEYHTEKNRYIIDPTWCDWDYVGEPAGVYEGNADFAEACRTSFNKDKLIEARSKEWFFRNVKTVTGDENKRVHGL